MPYTLEGVKREQAQQQELDRTAEAKRDLARRRRMKTTELAEREYIRHEIQAHQHVQDLETMALMLFSGQEVMVDDQTGVQNLVPLDKDRTGQLSACDNIKLALLRKVIPDIKSVELTGAGGEELGSQRELAQIELRNRLRAALTRGEPLVPGPVAAPEIDAYACLE